MIETLPPLTPDAQRATRTVARAHERLARRRGRRTAAGARPNTRYLAVERALLGAFCVIYISSVAVVAIEMLAGG